jgi:RNA polymerase sigma-70 factor (ECF subfamily)
VCLDVLRSRRARPEDLAGAELPEPVRDRAAGPEADPEDEAVLADSVGLALLVVLETLTPAERLAFVLHDLFAVPYDEIAPIVDRTPAAARQLASRARRRVHGARPETANRPGARENPDQHRRIVEAFLAASREGDFTALLALLDPEVVLRVDAAAGGPGEARTVRGAAQVAGQARIYSDRARFVQKVLLEGDFGLAVVPDGRLFGVLRFTTRAGKIVELEIVADQERLAGLDLVYLDD